MSQPIPSGVMPSFEGGASGANFVAPNAQPTATVDGKRKEIYRYTAPFTVYGTSWSSRPTHKFRLAIGSFLEEYSNKIEIVQLNEQLGEFTTTASFDHPYPATKVMWMPESKGPDLLASSGDYLRLWKVNDDGTVQLESLMNNNRTSDFCAPLTSFDWNETDVNIMGTSSIDTTCTIWSLETAQAIGTTKARTYGEVKTQLIAHDKEVYDMAFSKAGNGRDMFASVGADGSVRMFDLRHLEHSTIIYEDPQRRSLLRLAWCKTEPTYLVTVAQDSSEVVVVDVRVPCTPVCKLANHRACVNGVVWAPHSGTHLCSVGDDKQALIWDMSQAVGRQCIDDPILAYQAEGEINHVHWSAMQPDWIAVSFDNHLEILRV